MKYINRALIAVITVLMAAFVITMTANIVMRYVFSYSLVWSEEFARYSFIWVAMLGACLAFVRNEHLGFDLLVESLKAPYKQIVDLINHALVLVFLALFGYQGVLLALEAGATPSQSLGIPMGLVYVVLPLAAAIMITHLLITIWHSLKGFRTTTTDTKEA